MKNNKGFSLVELLITITIMTIIAAAVTPILYQYISKSRKADDIEAAKTIADAFSASLANEDVYEAATEFVGSDGKDASGKYPVILWCNGDDDEWTLRDGYDPVIKEIMDNTCPPSKVKYKKTIHPATADSTNADYITTTDNFTPGGWGICIIANETVAMITDGTTDPTTPPKAVSLSPVMCSDYKL